MKNTVIKVLSEEHGKEVVKYYEDFGINPLNLCGTYIGGYYGINAQGEVDLWFNSRQVPKNYIVIELPQSKPSELTYPRVMEVTCDKYGIVWYKRVVFMEKKGKFIAWLNATTTDQAEDVFETTCWDYAREISPKVEVTKQQIAEAFNTTVDNLIIKED